MQRERERERERARKSERRGTHNMNDNRETTTTTHNDTPMSWMHIKEEEEEKEDKNHMNHVSNRVHLQWKEEEIDTTRSTIVHELSTTSTEVESCCYTTPLPQLSTIGTEHYSKNFPHPTNSNHCRWIQHHNDDDDGNDHCEDDDDEEEVENDDIHQSLLQRLESDYSIPTTSVDITTTAVTNPSKTSWYCPVPIRNGNNNNYNENESNESNDCSYPNMTFHTAYSMVSSPQSSPTTSNHHRTNHNTITTTNTSCCLDSFHQHCNNTNQNNHNNSSSSQHKSCIGFMICFLLALSLPMAYQQYTLEERNFNVLTTTIASFHRPTTSNDVTSLPYSHYSIAIVDPEIPYSYPTISNDDNDNDDDHRNDDDTTTNNNSNNDDDATHSLRKTAWLMSFPGSLGISHIIQSIELYSQTSTATNYAATLLYPFVPSSLPSLPPPQSNSIDTSRSTNDTDDDVMVIVNPIYSIQPDDQCGPFVHRFDLPVTSKSLPIVTNTYCSTAPTTSSSVVCTECIATSHNALTFERACATGNRIYEQHYRSVQYDTRLASQFIQIIQNPFTTFVNRLRITFQQKLRMVQYPHSHGHHSDYFAQYIPYATNTQDDNSKQRHHQKHPSTDLKSSVSILEYCHYLDTTHALLTNAAMMTTDLLENYTHVPCHSEFYKYIQWYNDAVTLTTIKYNSNTNNNNNNNDDDNNNDDNDDDTDDSNKKGLQYIYYEKYITALLKIHENGGRNRQSRDDDSNHDEHEVQELLDFLNLPFHTINHVTDEHLMQEASSLYNVILYESSIWNETMITEQFIPSSMLQSVADMIYELSLPATWELLRHYVEPYLSSNNIPPSNGMSHYHFHWSKRQYHPDNAVQSIPMSYIYDTKIPDDSIIMSPLLFDTYADRLYENPFHEYDESLLHPPEPNDPNPQVVWLLSFPNSVRVYSCFWVVW
jgi:hypothetical protein